MLITNWIVEVKNGVKNCLLYEGNQLKFSVTLGKTVEIIYPNVKDQATRSKIIQLAKEKNRSNPPINPGVVSFKPQNTSSWLN